MRILVVCHYFPPEIGAPQSRVSELAAAWARTSDDVTVLTGMPNHPTGVVPPSYRRRLRVLESLDGYRIVRTWLYATPNTGMLKKTLGHLSFMITSIVIGLRASGPADVVVVSSPTFFSVFSARALAWWKRAKLVIEVRDLWPAIFVELGVLRNRLIIRLLEELELRSYRAADAVVVVTEGFRDDLIRRGVPANKVHVIPNGAVLRRFDSPDAADKRTRARLGAGPGETLVLYVGAHGISHGLEAVAHAAVKLAGEPIHMAFVGEGAAKERLEKSVREMSLGNVTLLPGVAREEVPGLLAAADICLVPLRDIPLFKTFIPSKMFEYLAASKAVIGSVRGEPARILESAGAVVVPPEDPAALADAVRELANDPARRTAMGIAGRTYVAANYDRNVLAQRYRAILKDVVRA
jgi:glycosyltransferase involved in cell wall biosynthesis